MKKKSGTIRILSEGKHLRHVIRNNWEYVQRKNITGIVAILAVTPAGRVVLVEQYREPLRALVIELPAGLVGDKRGGRNEAFETAAIRELEEETGYRAKGMEFLTEGPPSCGLSMEIVTFYRARQMARVGPGGGDEEEDIVVHEVPLAKVEPWLNRMEKAGRLVDPKVYTGLYFAKKRPVKKGEKIPVKSSKRRHTKRP